MIIELHQDVNNLLTKFRSIICTNDINLLPNEETKKKKKAIKRCDTTINCEILSPKKKKHPFCKRIRKVADVMVQFYREKIAWEMSLRKGRKLQILKQMGMISFVKVVMVAQYFMSVLPCPLCDSRMLQNK